MVFIAYNIIILKKDVGGGGGGFAVKTFFIILYCPNGNGYHFVLDFEKNVFTYQIVSVEETILWL